MIKWLRVPTVTQADFRKLEYSKRVISSETTALWNAPSPLANAVGVLVRRMASIPARLPAKWVLIDRVAMGSLHIGSD